MKKTGFTFLLLLLFSLNYVAAQGTLDQSFDNDGKISIDFNAADDAAYRVNILSNNKILLSGISWNGFDNDVCITRLNADGTVDSSFAVNGRIVTAIQNGNDVAEDCAIQNDGKIVIAGFSKNTVDNDISLLRFNPDGSLDGSFNQTGKVVMDLNQDNDYLYAVAVQEDQKILTAGFTFNGNDFDILVARFDSSGVLDPTFAANGLLIMDLNQTDNRLFDILIQPDHKILLAGLTGNDPHFNFLVARLNVDGTPDSTFNADGFVTTSIDNGNDVAYSLAIQSNQRIVVAGYSGTFPNSDFAVVRYRPNGSLDTTFNHTGKVKTDIAGFNDNANALAIDINNKINVCGFAFRGNLYSSVLAQYNPDGNLNNNFGTNGKVVNAYDSIYYSTANDIALQQDGKILLAGFTEESSSRDFAISRYLNELSVGISDVANENTSLLIFPNPVNENSILKYSLDKKENISISLNDLHGKLLKTYFDKESKEKGNHELALDIPEDFSSGIYILTLKTESSSVSIKIFK